MDNELKDIVAKLDGYSDEGWWVTEATQYKKGEWNIRVVRKEPKVKLEAANDNNE